MRLIFIRHAEPDYEHNTLTEKGFREAEILAERVKTWDHIRAIYVSPLPRAAFTCRPSYQALCESHAEPVPAPVTLEWLKEFFYKTPNPSADLEDVPWDFYPSFFETQPDLYDKEKWTGTPIYSYNPDLVPAYRDVCRHLDGILSAFGYRRDGRSLPVYTADPGQTAGDDEDTVLFFCHFGITSVLLSHLTGISPFILWHHTVELPTGVTVVNAEKREPRLAHFRIQFLGDTSHLREAGEPVSHHAAFSGIFQG